VISLDTKLTWRTQIPKRVFDVCVSLAGLAIAAPAMALIAILIKRDSGPAVFVQERIGRGGRTFNLYKFRTMIPDAEAKTGPVLAEGMADARLTRIGRRLKSIRLDELPQLWNVLRGDMSLVGPRPERPCFVTRFETLNPTYARRHDVRPGITGLAQIYGGYHTDWRDKLRFDLNYISRQSLLLDLRILLKTFSVVLLARHK
jgi:lipopolysaccharide/colanic/teichoic acid biosynthesis glycosyltransferase